MRKQTYNIRSNLTVTQNGVVLPKLPSVNDINIGEIAINYKDGYETISIKNDNNEIVTFATLELLINYIENLKLSSLYAPSENSNEDLALEPGDTYEEAFSKLEKAIIDNEETTAAALNDLNSRVESSSLSDEYAAAELGTPPVAGDTYEEAISKLHKVTVDNELVTARALTDLNTRLSEYDKAPLIIEVNDTNTTVPSGTYASITAALAEEREVVVKVTMTEDDEEIFYLNFVIDYSQADTNYYFNTVQYLSSYDFSIDVADQCSFNKHNIADAEHYHGNITNGGDITATAPTIANGDQLVINDHSASKITNGPTFDGSTTTTALTPKGTWEPFLKTAPVQSVNGQTGAVTLTLGQTNVIETVKVNNTALTPDANKAVNIDLSSYDKSPLIIDLNDNIYSTHTVPSGTYNSITAAIADGRDVILHISHTSGDGEVEWQNDQWASLAVYDGHGHEYTFMGGDYIGGGSDYIFHIFSNDGFNEESFIASPEGHSHGLISSEGTITSDTAIENGDKIVIIDNFTDDTIRNKISRSTITFDGSTTTTALTPKGTWETFLKTAPVTSVNGQTGAVSLTLGQTNVIETIKVNNVALTPDANKAVNIPITNEKYGNGFALQTDNGSTQNMTASLTDYVLTNNGRVSVILTHDLPYGATLNINNTGAKTIRNAAGQSLTDYHKRAFAGDIITVVYDGTNYRLVDAFPAIEYSSYIYTDPIQLTLTDDANEENIKLCTFTRTSGHSVDFPFDLLDMILYDNLIFTNPLHFEITPGIEMWTFSTVTESLGGDKAVLYLRIFHQWDPTYQGGVERTYIDTTYSPDIIEVVLLGGSNNYGTGIRYAVKDYDGSNGGEGEINDGLPNGVTNLAYFRFIPYPEIARTITGFPSLNESLVMGAYLVYPLEYFGSDIEDGFNPFIDICFLEITTTNYSETFIPGMHQATFDCTEYLLLSKKKRTCQYTADTIEMNPYLDLDYTQILWEDYDYFGGGGSGSVTNQIYYGTSSTAAATAQKEVSIPEITSLSAGQVIIVKPTVTSTVANSTIHLNSFTAYPMRYNNAAITTSTDSIVWSANIPSIFVFDGTYWQFVGHGLDSNTTYSTITQAEIDAGTSTSSRLMTPKLLRDNFYTETEVNNLIGAITPGDINIIESVKVNGTALTPDSNKAVDITVPTESTVTGWGFTKNAGTITGITMNGASKGTSGIVDLGTVITSETALSKGTTTGNGNAVTDISVSGHQITLTKGSTFLTSHLNIKTVNGNSLVGTGNVSIDTLPTVTSSDNGKVLQVVSGAWSLVMPTAIYSGTSTPNNSVGNDGDLYLQTS